MSEPVNIMGVVAFPNENGKRDCRFIDSGYNTLFTIPDGGNIIVTDMDGRESVRTCQYIDDTHVAVGGVPYEVLSRRYDNCVSALKWWCNEYNHLGSDKPSRYSIGRNRWLKEFMIANPPWFSISSKCCHYAKKLTSERFAKENGVDLSIIGVRKAEGGVRAFAYNGCFTANGCRATAEYRPLFWYTNATKAAYDKRFRITHSRCYEVFKEAAAARCASIVRYMVATL